MTSQKDQIISQLATNLELVTEFLSDYFPRALQPIYIGLYGSQNYNAHTDESDLDCICVVPLTLKDHVLGVSISEHMPTKVGTIRIVDVITFTKALCKGSPNHVEVANSPYYIGNSQFRDIISKAKVNPQAILGIFDAYLSDFTKAIKSGDEKKILKNRLGMLRMYRQSYDLSKPFHTFQNEVGRCLLDTSLEVHRSADWELLLERYRTDYVDDIKDNIRGAKLDNSAVLAAAVDYVLASLRNTISENGS